MSRANRKDKNHNAIVAALRNADAMVKDMTGDESIGFDLLVGYCGGLYMLEVKDGDQPPSRRRLTPNEKKTQADFARVGLTVYLVLDEDEALSAIGTI